jgi:DNA-directed RNA polymerase specialized sigma24 family protein
MDDNCQEVLQRVERIERLLSILATKDLKQREQIVMLSRAGITPREIAHLLGTTSNTVSVTLAQARKHSGRSKGKRN